MTDPQIAIFMLCLFIVLVLLGFPIAFTLIAMGVGFGYYAYYQGGEIQPAMKSGLIDAAEFNNPTSKVRVVL